MTYKKEQRQARRAGKIGQVIWVSCYINEMKSAPGQFRKIAVNGTRRTRTGSHRIRGKAAVKAAKRATHSRRYYQARRDLALLHALGASVNICVYE